MRLAVRSAQTGSMDYSTWNGTRKEIFRERLILNSVEDSLMENALLRLPDKGPLKYIKYTSPWHKIGEESEDLDWAMEHADEIYAQTMKGQNTGDTNE